MVADVDDDDDFGVSNGALKYMDMTMEEQRREILERLGVLWDDETDRGENPDTGITKASMNSLHAYLTGEYAVWPQRLFAPESPSWYQLKFRLARDLDISSYVEHYRENVQDGDGSPRAYNKDELARILAKMDETGDQRSLAGDSYDKF